MKVFRSGLERRAGKDSRLEGEVGGYDGLVGGEGWRVVFTATCRSLMGSMVFVLVSCLSLPQVLGPWIDSSMRAMLGRSRCRSHNEGYVP